MITITCLAPSNPGISGAFSSAYFDPDRKEVYQFCSIGSGWPMAAHNGRHYRLGAIPQDIADPTEIEEWVENNVAILKAIAEGYCSHWNGSNKVGQLGTRATELLEELRERWEEEIPEMPRVWAPEDYWAQVRLWDVLSEPHLTLAATALADDPNRWWTLNQLAEELVEEARPDHLRISAVRSWLEEEAWYPLLRALESGDTDADVEEIWIAYSVPPILRAPLLVRARG
jgi:hypothetical protein